MIIKHGKKREEKKNAGNTCESKVTVKRGIMKKVFMKKVHMYEFVNTQKWFQRSVHVV